MKAALTLPWLCCPCHGGEGGMGARTEGHPLPSTSRDPHLLLPSAGGIYDVPLQGQKAVLEIRWTDPLSSLRAFVALACKSNHEEHRGHRGRADSTFLE